MGRFSNKVKGESQANEKFNKVYVVLNPSGREFYSCSATTEMSSPQSSPFFS